MRQVVHQARQLAPATASVLLHGESGVGKEWFARSLHGQRTGAFVALNCAALVGELLASELFGYAEGAFTGARKGGQLGKIEAAQGGTLFLDEIAELPLDLQPQLLRVLELGEVCRLGESTPRAVDFRLVCATHQDLQQAVRAGRFRMDLYYRIAVVPLHIPALRERGDDVLLLAQHYLQYFRAKLGQAAETLPVQVQAVLLRYDWPGNVRELRNVMEAAVVLSEGQALSVAMLQAQLQRSPWPERAQKVLTAEQIGDSEHPVYSMQEVQQQAICHALAHTGGNLTRAAQLLGIAKSTLYAKMRAFGIAR